MNSLDDRFTQLNDSLQTAIGEPPPMRRPASVLRRSLPAVATALALLVGTGVVTQRVRQSGGATSEPGAPTSGAWFEQQSESMEPTVPSGARVLIDRDLGVIERGAVVLASYAHDHNIGVRRVIGLPRESVDIVDGVVTVDGVRIDEPYVAGGQRTFRPEDVAALPPSFRPLPVTLGPTEYFLLGDNRASSNDSRANGPIDRTELGGRVVGVVDSSNAHLPELPGGAGGPRCTVWVVERNDVGADAERAIRTDPSVMVVYRVAANGARRLLREAKPELDAASDAAPPVVAFVVNLGLPADIGPFTTRVESLPGIVWVACEEPSSPDGSPPGPQPTVALAG